MFGALKKVARGALEKFEALVNEDELKAAVATAVLIAAADGNISDQEKDVAFKAISEHEALRGFKQTTIRQYFDSYVRLVNGDKQLATEELESYVSNIKDRVARIRILGIASQIANADGEFSDAEKKVVDRIRKITG